MVNQTILTRAKILSSLRDATENVPGNRIAETLGLSRVAVWKHLESLKEAGYPIKADHSGYRLLDRGDFLYPWEFPGREKRIIRFANTDSTMDRALDLAMANPDSGAIVVAESQTRGRGRRGKKWRSPQGGLFATLVLAPKVAPHRSGRLIMAGGIALCEALRTLTGEPFSLEWPNDIFLSGRKAGGLLLEYFAEGDSLRFLDLGIGVNVGNPSRPGDFSLTELPGPKPGRRDVLSAFLDRFEKIEPEGSDLAERWNRLSPCLSKTVVSRLDGRPLGRACGIDDEGNMLAETTGKKVKPYRPGEALIPNKENLS